MADKTYTEAQILKAFGTTKVMSAETLLDKLSPTFEPWSLVRRDSCTCGLVLPEDFKCNLPETDFGGPLQVLILQLGHIWLCRPADLVLVAQPLTVQHLYSRAYLSDVIVE